MTTVSNVAFIAMIRAWPVAGLLLRSADSHFVMYFILHSWGNNDSLTITSIYLCVSCSGSIAAATADPAYAKQ